MRFWLPPSAAFRRFHQVFLPLYDGVFLLSRDGRALRGAARRWGGVRWHRLRFNRASASFRAPAGWHVVFLSQHAYVNRKQR